MFNGELSQIIPIKNTDFSNRSSAARVSGEPVSVPETGVSSVPLNVQPAYLVMLGVSPKDVENAVAQNPNFSVIDALSLALKNFGNQMASVADKETSESAQSAAKSTRDSLMSNPLNALRSQAHINAADVVALTE